MGALAKPQEEIFVREWVELALTADEEAVVKAYKRANYLGNPNNARRKAGEKHVKARFRELFEQALEYRDVRIAVIVNRIDRIGRANAKDFYDEDGRPKSIASLARELSEAIKAVVRNEAGEITDFEFWDKNQANFTLLKHMGGVPAEQVAVASVNVNTLFAGLSVDDQRTLAEALEAVPTGAQTVGTDAPGEHRP